jgi:hypothetical protein
MGIAGAEVPLPTYDSPIPAGATAVSEPVFLGRFPGPGGGTFDPPAYRHARRLHLILLNAGDRGADFQILVRPLVDGPPAGRRASRRGVFGLWPGAGKATLT